MGDTEKGIPQPYMAEPNKAQTRMRLITTLLVGTFVISLTALALAAAVYVQTRPEEVPRYEKNAGGVVIRELHDPAIEKLALKKIQSSLQHTRERRSADCPRTERCCSNVNAITVPTAHITATRFRNKPDITLPTGSSPNEQYSDIITKKWRCSSGGGPWSTAHVQGGMQFNSTSGFLTLPVNGTYFIYSQILFKIEQKSTSEIIPIRMGHRTVACDAEDTCEMTYHGTAHMESYTYPYNDYSNQDVHYHGGLFFFRAGTKIAIVSLYNHSAILQYKPSWEGSFMGAFLVNRDVGNVHHPREDDREDEERE